MFYIFYNKSSESGVYFTLTTDCGDVNFQGVEFALAS